MIKSVSFPEKGTGYLYDKTEKPCPPTRERYECYDRKTHKLIHAKKNPDYLRLMEQYRKDMEWYKLHKDEYIAGHASLNLIGNKFTFQDSKVNVIFGPNGSGKSTIIKAISGYTMCPDGFTRFAEPMDFGALSEKNDIPKVIKHKMKNSAMVDWDGVPVYVDNFDTTRRNAGSTLGGLCGSIIGESICDEALYLMNEHKFSSGQHTVYILNKIIEVAMMKISLEDIVSRQNERYQHSNDVWKKCGQDQVEYFSKFKRFSVESAPTMVFDEIDKLRRESNVRSN